MKISQRTLKKLGKDVTGDSKMTPYRSGLKLIELFNEFGFDDEYGQGFPARWMFAEQKLKALNEKPELRALIEHVFDPLEFHETDLDNQAAMQDMNVYLQRDGFELCLASNGKVKVRNLSGQTVEFETPQTYQPSSHEFVQEHVEKCERKLAERDFRGAATNARSLCEEVLCEIERQLDSTAGRYDGDLPKLFKRVRKLLKMHPDDYAKLDAVLVLLRGLTTVVDGLAGMSNALGDRHGGGGIRAKEHHARLAVNAANTLCSYMVSSFVHQNPGSG